MHETTTEAIAECRPQELNEKLSAGEDITLFDVREAFEFAGTFVAGSVNVPLSTLDDDTQVAKIPSDTTAYIICQSGARAKQAVTKLAAKGYGQLILVTGGVNAWRAAGLPTESGGSSVWSLERQVRVGAGLMIMSGVLLTVFLHPYFIAIPGFVGGGLIFAGVTDICGMGIILAKMPWNRTADCGCAHTP